MSVRSRRSLRGKESRFNKHSIRRHSIRRPSLVSFDGHFEDGEDEDFMQMYNEEEEASSEEEIFENIKLQKQIIENVRDQPWRMRKKMQVLRLAKEYVEKHEGRLSRSHGYQEKGAKALRRIKREVLNFIAIFIPWEMRVKAIESHYGSVVSSYFVFLRWMVWINIWLTILPICFIMIPEIIAGKPYASTDRKTIPEKNKPDAYNLKTVWDAEGVVRYSILFYGYYGSEEMIGWGRYRLPLAYFLTGLASFAFSFIVVLRRMAANSRMSRLSTKDEQFTFAWKLYTSWDYLIGNPETANQKFASISTTFKESILEEKEKSKEKKKKLTIFLRVLANVLVLIALGLSTWAIQVCVDRSKRNDERKRTENYVPSFWEENEPWLTVNILAKKARLDYMVLNNGEPIRLDLPHANKPKSKLLEGTFDVERKIWKNKSLSEVTVVMTSITIFFPSLFDLIALMEKYHPRTNLRLQLARIFVLNLLNIYTLFIALFWKQQDMREQIDLQLLNATTLKWVNVTYPCITEGTSLPTPIVSTIISLMPNNSVLPEFVMSAGNSTEMGNCTRLERVNETRAVDSDLCWETMIGQEVVKLTILDLVFTVGNIVVVDFLRGICIRYANPCCCWDLEKQFPEYGEFKTAENILHVINNQGMIWLGTFFCPGLPSINLIKLLILLYIRNWAVMSCNVPQEGIFRASRSNNFYYAMLLVMLFLCTLPVAFAMVQIEPSPNCGPFSGLTFMTDVISNTMEKEFSSTVNTVFGYVTSSAVIVPFFLLLALGIYYLIALSRALREANKDLKMQLEYERTEGRKKVYAMAAVKEGDGTGTGTGKGGTRAGVELNLKDAAGKGGRSGKRMAGAVASVMAATRMASMLSSTLGNSPPPVAVVRGKPTYPRRVPPAVAPRPRRPLPAAQGHTRSNLQSLTTQLMNNRQPGAGQGEGGRRNLRDIALQARATGNNGGNNMPTREIASNNRANVQTNSHSQVQQRRGVSDNSQSSRQTLLRQEPARYDASGRRFIGGFIDEENVRQEDGQRLDDEDVQLNQGLLENSRSVDSGINMDGNGGQVNTGPSTSGQSRRQFLSVDGESDDEDENDEVFQNEDDLDDDRGNLHDYEISFSETSERLPGINRQPGRSTFMDTAWMHTNAEYSEDLDYDNDVPDGRPGSPPSPVHLIPEIRITDCSDETSSNSDVIVDVNQPEHSHGGPAQNLSDSNLDNPPISPMIDTGQPYDVERGDPRRAIKPRFRQALTRFQRAERAQN